MQRLTGINKPKRFGVGVNGAQRIFLEREFLQNVNASVKTEAIIVQDESQVMRTTHITNRDASLTMLYGIKSNGNVAIAARVGAHWFVPSALAAGLIPHALQAVFDEADVEVECSFIEIYNEEIADLLADSSLTSAVPLVLREDGTGRNTEKKCLAPKPCTMLMTRADRVELFLFSWT
mmetsp:Transcript_1710/g.6295  ORF Transcript_1710/g.6295 Transcript_1710/m.6295 type:complete len:178 (-) Transcript_1710:960-1493(-)